jgi:hypothetical protein
LGFVPISERESQFILKEASAPGKAAIPNRFWLGEIVALGFLRRARVAVTFFFFIVAGWRDHPFAFYPPRSCTPGASRRT